MAEALRREERRRQRIGKTIKHTAERAWGFDRGSCEASIPDDAEHMRRILFLNSFVSTERCTFLLPPAQSPRQRDQATADECMEAVHDAEMNPFEEPPARSRTRDALSFARWPAHDDPFEVDEVQPTLTPTAAIHASGPTASLRHSVGQSAATPRSFAHRQLTAETTLDTQSLLLRRRVSSARSATLPAELGLQPQSRARSSSASSSSLSETASPPVSAGAPPTTPPAALGLGRKVADNLQLFQATARDDEVLTDSISRTNSVSSRRGTPSTSVQQPAARDDEEIEGYKLVKRSQWPDRHDSALRREKSSTALGRARATAGSSKDGSTSAAEPIRRPSYKGVATADLVEWRDEVQRLGRSEQEGRGRPRDRRRSPGPTTPVAVRPPMRSHFSTDSVPRLPPSQQQQQPLSQPLSLRQPPSPSPSRSPRLRRVRPASTLASPVLPPTPVLSPPAQSPRSLRPSKVPATPPPPKRTARTIEPPQLQLLPPPAIQSLGWSTDSDSESAWESASAATDTTTTTRHGRSRLPLDLRLPSMSMSPPAAYSNDNPWHTPSDDTTPHRSDLAGEFDFEIGGGYETPPTIPLRPFRNRVGGHSAIYKLTKRAVCKVRCLILVDVWYLTVGPCSLLFRGKTCSTKPLNATRHLSLGIFQDISASCLSRTVGFGGHLTPTLRNHTTTTESRLRPYLRLRVRGRVWMTNRLCLPLRHGQL